MKRSELSIRQQIHEGYLEYIEGKERKPIAPEVLESVATAVETLSKDYFDLYRVTDEQRREVTDFFDNIKKTIHSFVGTEVELLEQLEQEMRAMCVAYPDDPPHSHVEFRSYVTEELLKDEVSKFLIESGSYKDLSNELLYRFLRFVIKYISEDYIPEGYDKDTLTQLVETELCTRDESASVEQWEYLRNAFFYNPHLKEKKKDVYHTHFERLIDLFIETESNDRVLQIVAEVLDQIVGMIPVEKRYLFVQKFFDVANIEAIRKLTEKKIEDVLICFDEKIQENFIETLLSTNDDIVLQNLAQKLVSVAKVLVRPELRKNLADRLLATDNYQVVEIVAQLGFKDAIYRNWEPAPLIKMFPPDEGMHIDFIKKLLDSNETGVMSGLAASLYRVLVYYQELDPKSCIQTLFDKGDDRTIEVMARMVFKYIPFFSKQEVLPLLLEKLLERGNATVIRLLGEQIDAIIGTLSVRERHIFVRQLLNHPNISNTHVDIISKLKGFWEEDDELKKVLLKQATTVQRIMFSVTEASDEFDTNFLKKVRGFKEQSSNKKYDAWAKEFLPLVEACHIDLDSVENQKVLLEFIKRFGLVNAPELYKVFRECFIHRQFEDMSPETIEIIEEFGIRLKKNSQLEDGTVQEKWRFPSPKSVLDQINRGRANMIADIHKNKFPKQLSSRIGKEMFDRLVNVREFDRDNSVMSLRNAWECTIKNNPEIALLPDAYKISTLSVVEKKDTKGELSGAELIARWEKKGSETVKSIQENVSLCIDIARMTHDMVINKLQEIEHRLVAVSEQEHTSEKNRALVEKFRRLKDAITLAAMDVNLDAPRTSCSEAFVDVLNEADALPDDVVKWLVLAHIKLSTRVNFFDEIKELDIHKDAGLYIVYVDFMRDYMWEHYLKSDTHGVHSEHVLFTEQTEEKIRKVLNVTLDKKTGLLPAEMVVVPLRRSIRAQKKDAGSIEVEMVPNAGVLNIYAGNLGDGCHSSMEYKTASGEFPHLRTWVFIQNRGTTDETWYGSTLGIETYVQETDGTETPALVVRANNPKENFISNVDASDFVVQTLHACIDTARRIREKRIAESKGTEIIPIRKQKVTIPLDKRSQSCTNREDVYNVYERMFHRGSLPKVALKDQPETNYNGYNLHDPKSESATVTIWEIDEMGNETYYGDWSK